MLKPLAKERPAECPPLCQPRRRVPDRCRPLVRSWALQPCRELVPVLSGRLRTKTQGLGGAGPDAGGQSLSRRRGLFGGRPRRGHRGGDFHSAGQRHRSLGKGHASRAMSPLINGGWWPCVLSREGSSSVSIVHQHHLVRRRV